MQGVDGWDVDLPTDFEANWINNIFAKLVWVSTYIVVYGVRPLLIRPKVPGKGYAVKQSFWFFPCVPLHLLSFVRTNTHACTSGCSDLIMCAVDGADFILLGLVLGCDALVIYAWGFKAIMYLLLGSLLGGGLHPMAGHLIAEHYMFLKVGIGCSIPLAVIDSNCANESGCQGSWKELRQAACPMSFLSAWTISFFTSWLVDQLASGILC